MSGLLIQWSLRLFLVSVLLTILYNVFILIKYFRHVKFSYNACGFFLPSFPFVGTSYIALFTGRKVNMVATLLWAEKNLGLPLNFWFGHKYHYITNNAEEAKIVLHHPKCYNKAALYNDLQCLFRSSLLLVPAEKWKPRRHYLRTAFKLHMIKSFYSTFYHQSCLLVHQIKSMQQNKDLYKFFNRYAFLNFFLTASGLDGDIIDPEIERFGCLVDTIQDYFVPLFANPILPAYMWLQTPMFANLRRALRDTKKLMKELLLNRKQLRAEISEYIENPSDLLLIDLLLGEGYERERESDLFEELTLFASAATDTTGHTLAFCFTLMGMYPQVQRRVYDEVTSVVGDRSIEHRHIQDLKYTEAVISETLRILPSIPLFGRQCVEDIDLGTKVLPSGASVIISAFHIHRNPLYWQEPLKFDPSRFLPENASKIVPGSYLPFSSGPRNCIGQGLAMTLMKVTVANVIRNFRITSNHISISEFILESCVSMKTMNHLDCHFTLRPIHGNKTSTTV